MSDSSFQLNNETPDAMAKRLLQKAHNRDGLPEIVVGVFFLAVSALIALQVVYPQGSTVYKASTLGFVLLCIAVPLSLQWVIKKLRERFLTTKVGYVKLKPVSKKLRGATFGLAFVVAVAAVFAVRRGIEIFPPDSLLLAGTGIFGGAIAAFAGRLPRFVIGGVLLAATGILLAFSGVSLNMGLSILFGFEGILSLVSGCVVFSILMRKPTELGE